MGGLGQVTLKLEGLLGPEFGSEEDAAAEEMRFK